MENSKPKYDKILPPRIEDAGLEDCALPPDLINQAFLKAASECAAQDSSQFNPPAPRAAVKGGVLEKDEDKGTEKCVVKEKTEGEKTVS